MTEPRSGPRSLRALSGIARAVLAESAGALLVLGALATLVFFALRVLPGDPAALVLGDQADPRALAELRARLGLDRPLPLQYAGFLAGLARLDLGDSLARPGVPAFEEVGRALGPTAELAAVAVGLGAAAGLSLALLAVGPWLGAARERVNDAMMLAASVPLVAFAPLATFLLAVRLRVVPLPGDPDAGVAGLLFAAGLLAVPLGVQVGRIARAALLDQQRGKHLEVARAKGATELRVWAVHALPVASGPIAVVVGTQLGALLGGAVVLERLFERPGLGSLLLAAYSTRDVPVIEATVVASGALFVAAQALTALLRASVDPRGRR